MKGILPLGITCLGAIKDIAQKMKFSIKDFFSKCDQIYLFRNNIGHCTKNEIFH